MSRFLSALWRCEKNKPTAREVQASEEKRTSISLTAHEESRLSRSVGRHIWYNRRTEGLRTAVLPREPRKAMRGEAQAMDNTAMHDSTQHPLMRITTLGEFTIERLVRTHTQTGDEPPHYARVARSEWGSRGPAMTLLKVLLCRPYRRASRDELIEAIWPGHEAINAAHALDSAASVLRRHILRTGEAGSLLLTLRSGGETIFKLAGQH